MINYNCNEENKEYYAKFKEELKKVFVRHKTDIDVIPKILKKLGYKILYNRCKRLDYQGDIYLLYKKDNKYYFFESTYGSCTVCDVWYYCRDSVKSFMETFKDEDRSTVCCDTLNDLSKFIKKHCFFWDFVKEDLEEVIKMERTNDTRKIKNNTKV